MKKVYLFGICYVLLVIALSVLSISFYAAAREGDLDGKTFAGDMGETGKGEVLPARAVSRSLPTETTLSFEREPALEKNPGMSYDSPSLKAEDLPLVMSSADRKTISVVLPPFLYFKTQF